MDEFRKSFDNATKLNNKISNDMIKVCKNYCIHLRGCHIINT